MRNLITTVLSISFLAACASDGPVDELAGETPEDDLANADGKGDTIGDGAYTFFSLRADTRRCAAPYCGGDWLERLNRTSTVCHDGEVSDACYTPELDFTESGLKREAQDKLRLAAGEGAFDNGVRAIVRGRFARTNSGTVGKELGRFIVTEAWVAYGTSEAEGVFVRVVDSGIRCIVAPCPSVRETALNTSRSANITDVDFRPSGLDTEEIEEISGKMFEPAGLIIAGDRYGSNSVKGRTATNVFVRLENPAASEGCFVGGCSGQVCSDRQGVISTCEWRPQYACYRDATCERQADNSCGWTMTESVSRCLMALPQ